MKRRDILQGLGALAVTQAAKYPTNSRAARSDALDVIVVGAGVFGIWTAWHLHRLGKRVAVVEALSPAHSSASSGGESRVTRCGYGDAEIYTEWASQSIPAWQALSDRHSLPIFHKTGVLWLHKPDDAYVAATAPILERQKIPFQRLNAQALKARYPVIHVTSDEAGFLEPESGGLMARRAVQLLATELRQSGVQFIQGKVLPVESADAISRALKSITLQSGKALFASQFVFACGPWLDQVCPDVMKDRLVVTRQEVHYFSAGRDLTGDLPVWADLPFYGLPSLEGRGFKVANDTRGAVGAPDSINRHPSAEAESLTRQFLARRFPSLAEKPLTESRVCQYENSANADFVLDLHPGYDNAWLAGCGSGHGFKHGPAIGNYLAKRMFDAVEPIPRFSWASKKVAIN